MRKDVLAMLRTCVDMIKCSRFGRPASLIFIKLRRQARGIVSVRLRESLYAPGHLPRQFRMNGPNRPPRTRFEAMVLSLCNELASIFAATTVTV